jgi:hypothetical protein
VENFMTKRNRRLEPIEREMLRKMAVEKSVQNLDERIARQSDKTPLPTQPRQAAKPVGIRQPCKRQVYTTEETAKATVKKFKAFGIIGEIERCPICGFLHIKELRIE